MFGVDLWLVSFKNRKTSCHAGSLLIVLQWIWILKSDFCYPWVII